MASISAPSGELNSVFRGDAAPQLQDHTHSCLPATRRTTNGGSMTLTLNQSEGHRFHRPTDAYRRYGEDEKAPT